MKKKFLLVGFGFIFCSLLVAMSSGKPSSGNTQSLPISEYNALVTDNQGIQTFISQLNWNGQLYLEARRGAGKIIIPFGKIQSLELIGKTTKASTLETAVVLLKNQESIEVLIDGKSKFSGTTSFGQLEIAVQSLKQITFN